MLLITDLVGSVIVIAGFAWAAVRWGRRAIRAIEGWVRRVGDNTSATEELTRAVTGVLGDNTAATQQLTAELTGVRDDIREVVTTLRQHGERLDDHEQRIGRIEDKDGFR